MSRTITFAKEAIRKTFARIPKRKRLSRKRQYVKLSQDVRHHYLLKKEAMRKAFAEGRSIIFVKATGKAFTNDRKNVTLR